jgi:hypothetical protein
MVRRNWQAYAERRTAGQEIGVIIGADPEMPTRSA